MRISALVTAAAFALTTAIGWAAPTNADCLSCGEAIGCCDTDGCSLGDGLFGGGFLGGVIKPSDQSFDDFISPMTNPVFFEDPRTLTEARFIYIHHRIPTLLPGTNTDNVDLFALQLRAALTDRLSLIATKDGYLLSDSPLIDDGWADIAAGLKYNLIRAPEIPFLLSVGTTFELPTGSTRSLQGNGDGEFHLFATGMTRLAGFHFISASGFRLPSNSSAENQIWYWSNHVDRRLFGMLYGFTELNWYHWMKSGTAFPVAVEGGDLFNLGSVGVAGNDIVTGAFGVKLKPSRHMEIGLAWEAPLTSRRGVIDNRLTFDCILRY